MSVEPVLGIFDLYDFPEETPVPAKAIALNCSDGLSMFELSLVSMPESFGIQSVDDLYTLSVNGTSGMRLVIRGIDALYNYVRINDMIELYGVDAPYIKFFMGMSQEKALKAASPKSHFNHSVLKRMLATVFSTMAATYEVNFRVNFISLLVAYRYACNSAGRFFDPSDGDFSYLATSYFQDSARLIVMANSNQIKDGSLFVPSLSDIMHAGDSMSGALVPTRDISMFESKFLNCHVSYTIDQIGDSYFYDWSDFVILQYIEGTGSQQTVSVLRCNFFGNPDKRNPLPSYMSIPVQYMADLFCSHVMWYLCLKCKEESLGPRIIDLVGGIGFTKLMSLGSSVHQQKYHNYVLPYLGIGYVNMNGRLFNYSTNARTFSEFFATGSPLQLNYV